MQTPVHFSYSVKSEGSSMLGLALEFSSDKDRLDSFILVEYIKWSPDKSSPSSMSLSVKIKWGLKSPGSSYFRYNIYAIKVSATQQGDPEFIGTSEARAFYVSDLVLPSGATSVKFVVQLGGVDGAFQRLSESPFLLLKVPTI
ncbi:hypothetical protein MLD38_008779 [Melastoma candidum]|uniref:Uncharacterized protein n=1 Tax=Melastoma candidum TaxID=119954 RepID=A0ACB9RUK7_9MYRT|nr:hypothetical protein MLD38_008779 [Melastoma candidum]